MKKNYFFLAAAATLFAACAETDVLVDLSEKENAPKAIGFESFANKTTRAEITNLADLQEEGFQVWGYKTPNAGGSQYPVFENVYVYYHSSKWDYDDKQYWDKMSTYNFYAVAPGGNAVKDNYTIDPATGKITISNVESAKSDDSMDYLIDRNGNTSVNGSTPPTKVEFDFNHIMSKVSFKLESSINENITVTSLTMTGWNSGKGKFVQTLTTTPNTTNNASEWSIPTAGTGNISLVESSTPVSLTSSSTSAELSSYIMVPQIIAADALTFTINYKIGEEEFIGHVGKLDEAQTWGTDTHTIYTISVGPEAIEFTVSSVNDWTNSPTEQPGVSID